MDLIGPTLGAKRGKGITVKMLVVILKGPVDGFGVPVKRRTIYFSD